MNNPDSHSIMIVSKYFETIQDFINLEKCSKKYQGNMERFQYNPIPLTSEESKLFPNIKTYHIYRNCRKLIKAGFKYVNWKSVEYSVACCEDTDYKNIYLTGYADYDISKITIPKYINILFKGCCLSCTNLRSIKLHSSLKFIGSHCFKNCCSLKELKIPNSVMALGHYCFADCSKLNEISLPDSISRLGVNCFVNCSSLKNLTLPDSIKVIPESCFENCSQLNNVVVPTSVTKFSKKCFKNCCSLRNLEVSSVQVFRKHCLSKTPVGRTMLKRS